MKHLPVLGTYPDLQAFVHANNVRFWRKYILSVVVLAVLMGSFLPYLATAWWHWLLGGVLFLALSAVAFLWIGGYRHVTDPSFVGTVESLDCTVGLEMDNRTMQMYNRTCPVYHFRMVGQYQVNRCKMKVRTDDGETVTYRVHYWSFTPEIPLREGDRVVKYRGLPYPVKPQAKNELCAACGQINEGDLDGTCSVCGHTLIK